MRQEEKKSEDGATYGWLYTRTIRLEPPRQIERKAMQIYLSLLGAPMHHATQG